MSVSRTAIILLNLGGPDSREAVKPFLKNFFMDPNIIALPWPLRKFISTLIARRRSWREAADSYSLLGWKSPLLDNTKAQAEALESLLNRNDQGEYRCFVCMRYWHPRAEEIARQVALYAPSRIVLLPLYPQYSTATTRSSFQDWNRAAGKSGLTQPVSAFCCYPLQEGFVAASAQRVGIAYDEAQAFAQAHNLRPPRILFSAHGLPEKTIQGGDPYQWQCEQTAAAIAKRMDIGNLDWRICYQSRVGPLQWIGPSTIEAIEQAARDKAPVVIYPHAFVSEHVETLVEIGMEYRHLAEQRGVPYFTCVPTVGTDPLFIEGLADLIRSAKPESGRTARPICPPNRAKCCLRTREFSSWLDVRAG